LPAAYNILQCLFGAVSTRRQQWNGSNAILWAAEPYEPPWCFRRIVCTGRNPAGITAARLELRMASNLADVATLPDLVQVTLTINATRHALKLDPRTTLLDLLREHLDLTGTKKGCDQGQCGACTILVNGRRINSCLTFAVMHDGALITTVEGLSQDGSLHPLQQAFIDHDAFQCGYCTPGQICSAVGLMAEGKARTAEEIRELMSGNICRCGAYTNIVAAIQRAMGRS
jgi:xanthine dehydrogenase YagT iron-sulfur-binding subunit